MLGLGRIVGLARGKSLVGVMSQRANPARVKPPICTPTRMYPRQTAGLISNTVQLRESVLRGQAGLTTDR